MNLMTEMLTKHFLVNFYTFFFLAFKSFFEVTFDSYLGHRHHIPLVITIIDVIGFREGHKTVYSVPSFKFPFIEF